MLSLPTVSEIKEYFPYHRKCVVKNFLLICQCILLTGSCNMNKCKPAGSQALDLKEGLNLDTFYTRLMRFFGMKCADLFCLSVVHLILSIFSSQRVFYLAIDRTNWKIGNTNINILFLGLILPSHHYIPIWWFLLDKRGNSNQKERKQLLAKVLLISGKSSDKRFCVLADREFIGEDWLLNLAEKNSDFVIALRDNMYLNLLSEQLEWSKERLERWMKRKIRRHGAATIPIKIGGQNFNYVVAPNRERNAKYPFKKWISTLVIPAEVQEAYGLRWKIEVFFKDIKSNGFGLEEMNFIKEEKIAILIACVGFLFALSVKKGEIEYLKKNAYLKQNQARTKQWLAKSVFKKGREEMQNQVWTLQRLIQFILSVCVQKIEMPPELVKEFSIPKGLRKTVE